MESATSWTPSQPCGMQMLTSEILLRSRAASRTWQKLCQEKTRVYREGNLTVEEYIYGITRRGIRPYGLELSWERVGRTIELPRDVNRAQWLELCVTPEEEMAGELWHAVWSYTSQLVDERDSRSVVHAD